MPRVMRLEVMRVDLPFRKPFRHAAAARTSSESVFVKCVTDAATVGFGESLPRDYVTGESRDQAFDLLQRSILPRLAGAEFHSMEEVLRFLGRCDGKAPPDWVSPGTPQSAAWCAAELALLDAFGRAFREPVRVGSRTRKSVARYSGVVSIGSGWKYRMSLLKLRLYGLRQVKLKVTNGDPLPCLRLARRTLGRRVSLRIDANMAWDTAQALEIIRALEHLDIRCVEQPLEADDLDGLATLVRETRAEIIADEGFTDRASLVELLHRRACTGINVRISKCGGLVAAARRCEEARRAGLVLQVGCQVGESSLLSAAQRILISGVDSPKYLEGCYGRHLLRDDPVFPCLQMGYGGRPPRLPTGPGLGVKVDEAKLNQWVSKRVRVDKRIPTSMKEEQYVAHS